MSEYLTFEFAMYVIANIVVLQVAITAPFTTFLALTGRFN